MKVLSIWRVVWKTAVAFLCCALAFFAISIVLLIGGCDVAAGKYPWQTAGKWTCNDPTITMASRQLPNNTWSFANQLIWEDEEIDIDIWYQSYTFDVYPAGVNEYSGLLFSGTWRYAKGNLIFTIREDFIFDGAYSKLVFHRE